MLSVRLYKRFWNSTEVGHTPSHSPVCEFFYLWLSIYWHPTPFGLTFLILALLGKISAQPITTLCIRFLDRENNDKNNTLQLGKHFCFTIVWGCAEILPTPLLIICFKSKMSHNHLRTVLWLHMLTDLILPQDFSIETHNVVKQPTLSWRSPLLPRYLWIVFEIHLKHFISHVFQIFNLKPLNKGL